MFTQVTASRPVRAVVGAVLAGGLALGTAACAPSQTDIHYAPSDGIRIALDSGIETQNFMLISNGNGAPAVVGGALKNYSNEDSAVRIAATDGSFEMIFEIAAGELINFTENNEPTQIIESLNAMPGSNVVATFEDMAGNIAELNIPVLDGTLEEYAPLVP